MRILLMLVILISTSCNNSEDTSNTTVKDSSSTKKPVPNVPSVRDSLKSGADSGLLKEYANARFRKVTIQKVGNNSFRLRGQGQIFEASFNWVIEDGHEELANGYQMTDAGAPEWGNFDFTVKATKKRANSTLHIIIYEASAKDGSRQHELAIPLF